MSKLIIIMSIFSFLFCGTIEGTVTYVMSKAGKPLKGMDADPICGMAHSVPPQDENWMLNENNQFQNVIVWLKNVEYSGSLDTTTAIIDQVNCLYTPHMNTINSKQKVLLKNSDATPHNINSQHPNNEFAFNEQTPPDESILKDFGTTDEPFLLKCDIHGWMRAWVLVSDHPYHAVTDENGYFKIDNVPNGTYEIAYFQEKLMKGLPKSFNTPLNTATITVTDDGVTNANFMFERPTKK